MTNRTFGQEAEQFVASFLSQRDFVILTTNFYSPFGEIDLIAEKDQIIFAVEVKARRSQMFGTPVESVTPRKLQRIQKGIQLFALQQGKHAFPLRILIASVTLQENEMFCQLTALETT